MISSSTKFCFDNRCSDEHDPQNGSSLPRILNVTLNNEMHEFSVIGEKTIIEDQIQGRDEPYLYNVDHKPLEFTINIAFENYERIEEVTKVVKWLYNPKTYKLLKFENMDAEFFAIFIGSPQYYYVGRNGISFKEYVGYITCNVRANAPYGYTQVLTTTDNTGDLETYPSFTAKRLTAGTSTITNLTNGSTFTYLFLENETVTFNGYTKTLSSSVSTKNPYMAWGKDYLIFDSGQNNVTETGLEVTYSYRAPKYL